MKNKIIGALLLILLVLGSSGCARPFSSSTSPTPSPATDTANEPTQTDPANNPPQPAGEQGAQEVPILYYHSVMQENGNELRMPPQEFAAQMAYLQAQGYQSVSLDQLYQASYHGGTLPPKPVVITFDDGYADNYTTAFPILAEHGYTATVFMVTSYIGGEGFMSWPQLKELVAKGWEIEGHTINHPHLTKMDAAAVKKEVDSSKKLLETELAQPVNFFAYPYGEQNASVVKALKETGYLMAVTTERGWADVKKNPWQVQRIYCSASMGMNEFTRRLQNPNY